MSAVFIAVATLTLMSTLAIGQWIDRQCHGAPLQEWRDRWN